MRLDLDELSLFVESTIEVRPAELVESQRPTVKRQMSEELDSLRD